MKTEPPQTEVLYYRLFPDTLLCECRDGELSWHSVDCGEFGTLSGRAYIDAADAAKRTLWLLSWKVRSAEDQFTNNEEAWAWIANLPPWTKTKLIATWTGVVLATCEL